MTICRYFFLFCLQYIDILVGSANIADAIDTLPQSPILMTSAMPVDSTPAADLGPKKNHINAPSSKPHPLLRLPTELAFYVSRTDDTLLRLNKYAPASLDLAKLTAHLKAYHHNCWPRISTLDTKLLLLPAHISPCSLSVALEYRTPSFSPPTPPTHAPRPIL